MFDSGDCPRQQSRLIAFLLVFINLKHNKEFIEFIIIFLAKEIAKVECEGHPLVKIVAKPNVNPKQSP
jgi:hypothetical protein